MFLVVFVKVFSTLSKVVFNFFKADMDYELFR